MAMFSSCSLPSSSSSSFGSARVALKAKGKKRKGAPSSSNSEKKKPKKRQARKPKGSIIALSLDSVHRLRDESKDEEQEKSNLVAREEADEGASVEVPKPKGVETIQSQAETFEGETGCEASRVAEVSRGTISE
ncbi:PREDICTED: ADP-ribosylation factor-like protein 6-interacting protein 4 [Nicotiana attenuata]|uniref:ADP-ribosylation factor-like protein 6-interacting protein 4 n=1 Tax=Nicotiana attenuata TaxID=49451 RepID=UPI0009054152|nr:PREDICTED: ADP-ribosylation factor-like protein 6-interacting protein 4 [Nicotiana attenuata]